MISGSDLQKLFDSDPLSLSAQNLDDLVAYYREARKNFNLEGKSAKPKAKEKVSAIDLDDLLGGGK